MARQRRFAASSGTTDIKLQPETLDQCLHSAQPRDLKGFFLFHLFFGVWCVRSDLLNLVRLASDVWPHWPVINLNKAVRRKQRAPTAAPDGPTARTWKEKKKKASCLYANMCSTRSHYSRQGDSRNKSPKKRKTSNTTHEKGKENENTPTTSIMQ